MFKRSNQYQHIDAEKARDVLKKIEKELRDKFEEIRKITCSPNTKGRKYEETAQKFFANYLGGVFCFEIRKGILDVELRADEVFNRGENEFDVVAIYKNAIPRLVYDPFVPYDAVAFVTEVKQTLTLPTLRKDLQKLEKLRQLKLVLERFKMSSYQKSEHLYKLDRPARNLFYYELNMSMEKITQCLEEFRDAWDTLLVLKKDMLIANTTLPLVSQLWGSDKHILEGQYSLLKALYFTCYSIPGVFVDSWLLNWNLFRSIAPKK
jgi:hypothetical protein